jgi:hypothetical protein
LPVREDAFPHRGSQFVQARFDPATQDELTMHELKIFQLISWISLPTVMFGGYSLLGAAGDKLTPEQRALFRAGHAHAGVLLILSLVYEIQIAAVSLPIAVKQVGCALLIAGILLQSGGFFWRAFLGSAGKNLTRVGALLLAVALVLLIGGLFAS